MKSVFAVIALAVLTRIAAQTPPPERRVAITIDDGPVVNELKDLANFQRISAGLIGSLQAEKIPATIFINERQLNVQGQRDGRAAVLAQWLNAGFDLGNHTYSHPTLNKVPLITRSNFREDQLPSRSSSMTAPGRLGPISHW